MAAPRRGCIGFLLICLATLAMTEYAIIAFIVQPLPSTRFDWQFATLFVAPMSAALLLWSVALTVRIVLDIWTFLRFVGQLITGARR